MEDSDGEIARHRKLDLVAPQLGLLSVTMSALLFGIGASMVKGASLPPLVMLQGRAAIHWVLSMLSVALCCEKVTLQDLYASDNNTKRLWGRSLFGPKRIWHFLLLRALLYWVFTLLFWSALVNMPVGDATAIVYCGPVFTNLSAVLFLRERLQRSFLPCLLLNLLGVLLITQPAFLFPSASGHLAHSESKRYFRGVGFALAACCMAGQIPVLARASRECHWSTVEHVNSFCSTFVFTPIALVVWWQMGAATGSLFPRALHLHLWELVLVCGAAVVFFIGMCLQTIGYQNEEVTRASLMVYVEVPFSYVLQLIFFKHAVSGIQVLGILAIVSSAVTNFVLSQQSRDK